MKRLALAAVLALAMPLAQAAPPSAAQVDALLQAMDVRGTTSAMAAQLETSTREMAQSMLGAEPTPAQREAMDRAIAESNMLLRELMDWRRVEPMYREIYADVFTAEEVEAMTRFYGSPEGRSMLAKMPQVIDRSMRAIRPLMDEAVQRMQAGLKARMPTSVGEPPPPAP